jgi:hypothetical protein
MANTSYIHASKPELVSGLRAVKMYGDVMNGKPTLGVILGRYQSVPVIKGRHKEIRKTPDRASDSQVIWVGRKSQPFVRDGKVYDASVVKAKGPKGGTLTLLSAPDGRGGFIVHAETGIPRHWELDSVAAFMQGLKPDQMRSHGSERIDDGSEHVLAHRIRWQRPQARVAGSADALSPSKGVRIYSGDVWIMYPGAEILVHDITGHAFRIVCDKDGPKVADPGTSDPYEKYIGLVQGRKNRLVAADAAVPAETPAQPAIVAPQPEKTGGMFSWRK